MEYKCIFLLGYFKPQLYDYEGSIRALSYCTGVHRIQHKLITGSVGIGDLGSPTSPNPQVVKPLDP